MKLRKVAWCIIENIVSVRVQAEEGCIVVGAPVSKTSMCSRLCSIVDTFKSITVGKDKNRSAVGALIRYDFAGLDSVLKQGIGSPITAKSRVLTLMLAAHAHQEASVEQVVHSRFLFYLSRGMVETLGSQQYQEKGDNANLLCQAL